MNRRSFLGGMLGLLAFPARVLHLPISRRRVGIDMASGPDQSVLAAMRITTVRWGTNGGKVISFKVMEVARDILTGLPVFTPERSKG